MKVFATTLAALAGFASAACPNNCAGHGTCGDATQCDCYRNWFGADCSQRVCTYSAAFVDSPVGDLNGDGEHGPARYFDPRLNTKVFGIDFVGGGQSELYSSNYGYARTSRTTAHDEAHFYRECANKGTCDRTTGLCSCFPGYEGEGCTRTTCPSGCSGHGRCRTIQDSAPTYSAWDLEHTQQCLCDPGYSGPSCSMRDCPSGADPVEYALEVTNSVQGIFWRSFSQTSDDTALQEQAFAARMPGTVHYTLTFTDEFGDEHVTSLLSVEYKSTCAAKFCTAVPDFTKQTLQEHAEATNQSIGALPLGAIENKYVWTVGTTYNAKGEVQKQTDPNAADPKKATLTNVQYPRDFGSPASVFVDALEYRLDQKVVPTACQGLANLAGTGTAKQYGLCMFIQIENPGVQEALKVQYFYIPRTAASKLGATTVGHVVRGETKGFNTAAINQDANKEVVNDATFLVTVQDLNAHREWNANDGDVAKTFIAKNTHQLPQCSKRGLCDYDTGMCDCFSGYSGIRCDDQNAIAYSY